MTIAAQVDEFGKPAWIALVVAVFAVLMSMSEGFKAALRSTGRPDNAIVVQRGSSSEELIRRLAGRGGRVVTLTVKPGNGHIAFLRAAD